RRSLTRYFPEIMAIERSRYPLPAALHDLARVAGLRLVTETDAVGDIPLTDEFLARLAAKCSSAMRLMAPEDHAAGMDRLRAAQRRGEKWRSCYTVLEYGFAGESARPNTPRSGPA